MRPLGSEKLQGDEKIKRILEITNYQRDSKSVAHKNAEYITESVNGYVYGIVREKDGYYVKKGLNESTLDYIGGLFMKNKNRFKSYAEALKRLNLISGQEALNEEKRYILKRNKPETEAPVGGSDLDAPDLGGDMPTNDVPPPPAEDVPPAPESDVSGGNDPLLDDGMNNEVGDEPMPEEPVDDMNPEGSDEMGADGGEQLRSSYMSEIQKYAGKLGQELRDQKEKMESDDIKYVLNMVISAVDLNALDDEDLEEIADKFEKSQPSFDELDEPSAEEAPVPEPENELAEMDMEEQDNATGTLDISQYADLDEFGNNSEGGDFEDVELDLDELMKDVNNSVNGTLSKYFK